MDEIMKSLVLGVGAQSAGTLMLYNILKDCSGIGMHPLTELHYFDTLYHMRDQKILTEHAQSVYDYEQHKFENEYNQTYFNARHETLLASSKLLANNEVKALDYWELFHPMSLAYDVLGEITPEYMLLDDEEVEKMGECIGKKSKIILLVRDPLDRFLDSLRLLQPKLFTENRRQFEKKLLNSMLDHDKWLAVQDRFNQYEETYERYRKVFDSVLMLPFEKFKTHPEEILEELEIFLGMPIEREKAISVVKAFFEAYEDPVEITESLRIVLGERYKNTRNYLYDQFPDSYARASLSSKISLEDQNKKIIEQKTYLSSHIKGFDKVTFLDTNPDLKEQLDGGGTLESELNIPMEILDELAIGKRAFHDDYIPFNEELYIGMYPDVKRLIHDATEEIQYGFDHFCQSGYLEIIGKSRKWPKKDEFENLEDNTLLLRLPWSDVWMKEDGSVDDPFYVSTFLNHIDISKYEEANPDVKRAMERGDLVDAKEHLCYHGIADIAAGGRKPYPEVDMADAILASVDFSYRIDEDALYITGWLYTDESQRKIEKIYLSNGEYGFDLTEKLSRFDRPDLENMLGSEYTNVGFCIFAEAPIIDMESKFSLLFITDDGLTKRVPISIEKFKDAKDASRKILSPLVIDSNLFVSLDRTMGAALKKYILKYPLKVNREKIQVFSFGEMAKSPKVSIIIPLYGRIDFMEYQLSLFANDPFFLENVDLVYVLDDPSKKDALILLAQELYPLFEIPYRVVVYDDNYGYAIANNIGVNHARAEKVLLLNSDIMPLDKVWLQNLLETYDALDGVGALGCKLLFEDGAIQHAGMAFEKSARFGMWLNEHPGKGLPDLEHSETAKEVPAVTAACLLVDRELYEKVGGLSENYLLGDFEDSDFCLKMITEGKKNYYLPTVSLCHLERQSQNLFSDTSWKTKLTLFNGWQHTKKWDTLITKLMGDNQ